MELLKISTYPDKVLRKKCQNVQEITEIEKESEKIIGGQILSDSKPPVKHIDLLSLAIRCGLRVED